LQLHLNYNSITLVSSTPRAKLRYRIKPRIAHPSDCDCDAHEVPASQGAVATEADAAARWTAWLPALACLVCPACLSLYAKVLAAIGVGVVISERQHDALLAFAVVTSLLTSAYRTVRTGRRWPLAVTSTGAALVTLGHLTDRHPLEWIGVLCMLASGLLERRRSR
jgi:hypothetical protein